MVAYLIAVSLSVKEVSKRETEENTDNNEGFPPYIELLRGRDGRDGRDEEPGPRGPAGATGERGTTGLQGPPGPSSGGVTYIRWGRTTCPNTTGTELVYSGRAAGTYHTHQGGTNDNLCLPSTPEYSTYRPGAQGYSPIYGTEYETNHDTLPIPGLHNHNVPCAVCLTTQRETVLMIPARMTCPSSWTLEYSGYLMTDHYTHRRRASACVDKNADSVRGESADTNGALFYHTEAVCNGIECPPYDPQKELTCAVCTK